MNKLYEVFIQDEYNNNWWLGWYANLDDSIDDINGFILEDNLKLSKGGLQEYMSTLGYCFDREVYDDDGHYYCIRGFIHSFNDEEYETCKRIFVKEKNKDE